MKVKIDTKQKMHVITLEQRNLAANMTEDLKELVLSFLQKPVKNVVLNLEQVKEIDEVTADLFLNIQHQFYEDKASLVFCNLDEEVQKFLEEKEILEQLNVTPTQSEAWDMVQMEEIERELL